MSTQQTVWLTPAEAARRCGVTTRTLRTWEKTGRITGTILTPTGHRRYNEATINALLQPPAA